MPFPSGVIAAIQGAIQAEVPAPMRKQGFRLCQQACQQGRCRSARLLSCLNSSLLIIIKIGPPKLPKTHKCPRTLNPQTLGPLRLQGPPRPQTCKPWHATRGPVFLVQKQRQGFALLALPRCASNPVDVPEARVSGGWQGVGGVGGGRGSRLKVQGSEGFLGVQGLHTRSPCH